MDSALPPVTLDELSVLSRRAATVIDRLRERVFAPGTRLSTCSGPVKSSWVTRGKITNPIWIVSAIGVS